MADNCQFAFVFPTPCLLIIHLTITPVWFFLLNTVLILLYGISYCVGLFVSYVNIVSLILVIVIFFAVVRLMGETMGLLSKNLAELKKELASAEKASTTSSDSDVGSNVPLIKSQVEHVELQILLLKFVFHSMNSILFSFPSFFHVRSTDDSATS